MEIKLNTVQVLALADILMGAAHADDEFDGMEAGEISDILHDIVGEFSTELSMRLASFDEEDFDLKEACKPLLGLSPRERQGVVARVARVTESDGIHDIKESQFIRRLIGLLECDLEGFDDHVFEVEIVTPPPLPKS
ncbi:hypothetical protein FRD01_05055 [Microvenator marinus]|jgi:uncharacterized tellurite resistance protein B-like protein|uniref:Co-chaperone DjlA N-terminal domain-containing protein n=1 Tax=Microvenator marinus TaxID=2600177 RepID=A0A5B8XRH6_9DELT|nr:TerB family tellurite resistance protein [Microvenator marinus]QED26623.1 hypothetical protein FRD01_05055 [Microvenator marinus]